ncbi:MAG: hypothetical protein ACI9EW_002890 [Cellvibrionaceae bacterium]|jgi:hypothetical protein
MALAYTNHMPASTLNPKIIFSAFCLTLLFLVGCGFVDPPVPTIVPTVTPPSDMLSLTTAKFTYTLVENAQVPGTDIIYRTRDENNIFIDMQGQPSVRRFGDNLNGSKVLVPGVMGNYSLRLVDATFGNPYIFGPVTLTIFNPAPVEMTGATSGPVGASIVYDGINIDYRVPRGRSLPGSTVTYLGRDDFGAILGGSSQYRSLPEGNSFVWTGRLHAYAIIQYDLKAVRVTPEELQMVGSAKLYLYNQPLLITN